MCVGAQVRRGRVGVLVMLLLMALSATTSAQTGSIAGSVIAEGSNTPIAAARVFVVNSAGATVAIATAAVHNLSPEVMAGGQFR